MAILARLYGYTCTFTHCKTIASNPANGRSQEGWRSLAELQATALYYIIHNCEGNKKYKCKRIDVQQ